MILFNTMKEVHTQFHCDVVRINELYGDKQDDDRWGFYFHPGYSIEICKYSFVKNIRLQVRMWKEKKPALRCGIDYCVFVGLELYEFSSLDEAVSFFEMVL